MKKHKDFESLVDAHSREMFRYATALGGNPQHAEDLVQEAFLRAWKHIDRLREPRAVRGWLYTILRNEHARQHRNGIDYTLDPEQHGLTAEPCYDTSTEAFALRCALRRLPLGYREPLLLQVIGGFSCAEIANMLALTPNAVMARVSRARRQLRDCLNGNSPDVAARRVSS